MSSLAIINETLKKQNGILATQLDVLTKQGESVDQSKNSLDLIKERIADLLTTTDNNQKKADKEKKKDRLKAEEDRQEALRKRNPIRQFAGGFAQGSGLAGLSSGMSWMGNFMSNFLGDFFGEVLSHGGKLARGLGLGAGKLIKWGAIGGLIATYFDDEISAVFKHIEEWTGINFEQILGENPLLAGAATIVGGMLVDSLFKSVLSWSKTGLLSLTGLISKHVAPLLAAAFPRMIPAILGPVVSLLTGPVGLAALAGAAIIGGAVLLGNYLEEKRREFIKEIDGAVADGIEEIKNEGEIGVLRGLGVRMGFVTADTTSEKLLGLEQTLAGYKHSIVGGRGPMTPEMRAKGATVDWSKLEKSLGPEAYKAVREQTAAIKKSIETPGFLASLSQGQLEQLKDLSVLLGDKNSVQLIDKTIDWKIQSAIQQTNPYYGITPNLIDPLDLQGRINTFQEYGIDRDRQRTSPSERGLFKTMPSTATSLSQAATNARVSAIINNAPVITNITNNNSAGGNTSIMTVPVGTTDKSDRRDTIRRYGPQ